MFLSVFQIFVFRYCLNACIVSVDSIVNLLQIQMLRRIRHCCKSTLCIYLLFMLLIVYCLYNICFSLLFFRLRFLQIQRFYLDLRRYRALIYNSRLYNSFRCSVCFCRSIFRTTKVRRFRISIYFVKLSIVANKNRSL